MFKEVKSRGVKTDDHKSPMNQKEVEVKMDAQTDTFVEPGTLVVHSEHVDTATEAVVGS